MAAVKNTFLGTESLFSYGTRLFCIPWTQIQPAKLGACSFTALLLPSIQVSCLAHFSHWLIWHQSTIVSGRGLEYSTEISFAQPVQLFVCFKAKLLLWKCPSVFFLHISTSYKPNKTHPSSALTMDWGERSGVRVCRKSTARGQKACW